MSKNLKKRVYEELYSLNTSPIDFFLTNNKVNKNALYLKIPIEFNWCESKSEYLYCVKNNIYSKPICSYCHNKPLKFLSFEKGFSKGCSSKCASLLDVTKIKRLNTVQSKYGVNSVMNIQKIKNKVKQTKLVKYGDENYNNLTKAKETNLLKYGVDNYFKISSKRKGWEYKRVDTIKKRALDNGLKWVFRPDNIDNNLHKRKQTNLLRYGVEHYVQSVSYQTRKDIIVQNIFNKKIINGTTNSSNEEDDIYKLLKTKYVNVFRNYKSELYPFNCDYYIKDIDMYIEYQGYFTHGYKAYFNDTDDLLMFNKWLKKSENSTFYKNALNVWTTSDVLKRSIALKNNLIYLEIFDKNDIFLQIDKVLNGLVLDYSSDELHKEFIKIKGSVGNLNSIPNTNKIILQYQQKLIFEKENNIYKTNPILRRKLIQNRLKYLNKKEYQLSNRELISGFKISGIHQGYSFFSPLWFKWFIKNYDIKSCYDPFGGWGHRLLGGMDLDRYIYNDLNKNTYNNVLNIIKDFNINNTICYNNDAYGFRPIENFEAIFTCPPYDDLENFNVITQVSFKDLLINVIVNCYLNTNCKIFGIVILECYENILIENLGNTFEKYVINNKVNHFKTKQNFEYLYIFKK